MTLCIALVGAESTGKSTLAQALAHAFTAVFAAAPTNTVPAWRVALVPETLREWCDREGRTPRAEEQRGIMAEHHRRIEQAAQHHDIVLCDTSALMTAVYSRTVFGDRSLDTEAVSLHRTMNATLLMALDLPWVGDGLQRDGEHVRQPVDAALRELLLANGLAFSVISGRGAARTQNAQAAVAPLLRGLPAQTKQTPEVPAQHTAKSTRKSGAFSKLLASGRAQDAAAPAVPESHTAAWACACCSVPEFERALARGAAPYFNSYFDFSVPGCSHHARRARGRARQRAARSSRSLQRPTPPRHPNATVAWSSSVFTSLKCGKIAVWALNAAWFVVG